MDVQIAASKINVAQNTDNRLASVGILEEAKENAGRLRVVISDILSRDEALTDNQLAELTRLKSALASSLNAPALTISESTGKLLQNQKASSHWQKVDAIYATIVSQAGTGSYEVNADSFFRTISRVVDDIGKAAAMELNEVHSYAERLNDTTAQNFVLSVVCFLLSIAAAGYMYFTSTTGLRPQSA
jgi:hypothetical protein